MEGPITIIMASSTSVKDFIMQQTLKEPKFAQLDKVLYKWLTAMCSERKPMTEPMVIVKAKFIHDGMKITDKCTFSEGSNKMLPVRTWVSTGAV
jgi:hypothetical protein